MFHVNQHVIYRPRHQSDFIHAVVVKVGQVRVTIEFEIRGDRIVRSVNPDRLLPTADGAGQPPSRPGP